MSKRKPSAKQAIAKPVGTMVETLETRRLLAVGLGAHGHPGRHPAELAQNDQPTAPASDATTCDDAATAEATVEIPTDAPDVVALVDTGAGDIGADESDGPGATEDPTMDVSSGATDVVVSDDAGDIVTADAGDTATDEVQDTTVTETPETGTIDPIAFDDPTDVINPEIPVDLPTDLDVVSFDDVVPPTDVMPADQTPVDTLPDHTVTMVPTDTPVDMPTDTTGDDSSVAVLPTFDSTDTACSDSNDVSDFNTSSNPLGPVLTATGGEADDASASPIESTASNDPVTPTHAQDSDHAHDGNSGSDSVASSSSSDDTVFAHIPLPPVLSGVNDFLSVIHTVMNQAPTAQAAAPAPAQPVNEQPAEQTASAQSRAHTAAHETVTVAAVTPATFSSTPIQPPAEPAAPQQNAPLVSQAEQAITSTPVESSAHIEQTDALADEHLKLKKVVVTFDEQAPLQLVKAEPQQEAQPAAATIAPAAAPVQAAPGTIQLVQEIDVAPAGETAQATQQADGQQAAPKVIVVPVVHASVASALTEASNSSRNALMAVAAGLVTLAVHSYRTSRRKLAAAARAAHLDPLAAWLDDPTCHVD